jgi:DNA-binding transcriptional LysR family regulator
LSPWPRSCSSARPPAGGTSASQQLRRLERGLGAELFDRSPRHVRLTAAGAALLPQERDVLAAVARVRTAVAEASGVRPGPLRGTSSGLGERLEPVLAGVGRQQGVTD